MRLTSTATSSNKPLGPRPQQPRASSQTGGAPQWHLQPRGPDWSLAFPAQVLVKKCFHMFIFKAGGGMGREKGVLKVFLFPEKKK